MDTLYYLGHLQLKRLAEKIFKTRVVDSLEKCGFVRQKPESKGRCLFSVHVTVKDEIRSIKHFPSTFRGKDFAAALAQRFFNLIQPVRPLEYFAGLRPVGWADDPISFHQIDQVSGAAITDAQAALQ